VNKEELNELTLEELKVRLEDDIDALKNLRFQKAMQQLENPLKIKEMKKEIAQLKTVIHEYKLGIRK
jgi:large subunit ribosomal protein L29